MRAALVISAVVIVIFILVLWFFTYLKSKQTAAAGLYRSLSEAARSTADFARTINDVLDDK